MGFLSNITGGISDLFGGFDLESWSDVALSGIPNLVGLTDYPEGKGPQTMGRFARQQLEGKGTGDWRDLLDVVADPSGSVNWGSGNVGRMLGADASKYAEVAGPLIGSYWGPGGAAAGSKIGSMISAGGRRVEEDKGDSLKKAGASAALAYLFGNLLKGGGEGANASEGAIVAGEAGADQAPSGLLADSGAIASDAAPMYTVPATEGAAKAGGYLPEPAGFTQPSEAVQMEGLIDKPISLPAGTTPANYPGLLQPNVAFDNTLAPTVNPQEDLPLRQASRGVMGDVYNAASPAPPVSGGGYRVPGQMYPTATPAAMTSKPSSIGGTMKNILPLAALSLGSNYLGAKSQAETAEDLNKANQKSYQEYLSLINPPQEVLDTRYGAQKADIMKNVPALRTNVANQLAGRGIRGKGAAAPVASTELAVNEALNKAYGDVYGQHNIPSTPGPANYAPSSGDLSTIGASQSASQILAMLLAQQMMSG